PQEDTDLPPRKCIIFCPKGDRDRLFEEVDRKTAVPLIPAFKDYVLDEMEERGILQQLTVVSIREKIDAWVMQCENDDKNIVSVVEDGLATGKIAIPGEVKNPDGFDGVENVTGYLNTFGVTVAERIRSQFEPLFDPANEPLSQEILEINDYVREHAGYPLYDAQLAVAEAVKRQLQKDKCAFIVAECGSGKTKIGSVAMTAALNSIPRIRRKTFNIILCPSHVAKKWVREIAETLPNTFGMVVHSITEFDKLYELYEQGDKSVCAIISKEKARDGYMKRPAVQWHRTRKNKRYVEEFVCPDCRKAIELPFQDDDGVPYLVPATQMHFRKESKKNHKCPNCGSLLWTAVNPDKQTDWVKIGGYGWVYRYRAWEHYEHTKNAAVRDKLHEIETNPYAPYRTIGACRRYPLSSYIKRTYAGRIDCLIADELHQYNNDSGQGDAMGEIYAASNKFIGMTATLINGYASGIFHLLYRTMPQVMLQDRKPYASPGEFNSEYGVEQIIYEETDPDYAANRRASKSNRRVKQLPGVSPLVYSRFLLEKTAFLSLNDMGKELPDYEEIPIPVHMASDVADEYEKTQNVLTDVLKGDRKIAQKILSAYLNLLTIYPDQPYDQKPILHPQTGLPIVEPASFGDFDTLGEKETAVADIVRRKVEEGEHVLIYTSWVRSDSQKKLHKLLTEQGFHTEIMSEKVKPDEREDWVQKRLAAGMQVMITNPSLVETGLDLNTFTTLIFYSMGYKLFTLR
ncbi:MAG: DEAD/DEAH box helicase family protein, partial [Oscillospiraceae bacterium]|nr:DEAD/DEAH box helicase family protein [Oscillospiraceae bacterium]